MRGRLYWRVSPAFWGDEKVKLWSDDMRVLALYLLTCPHRTAEGLFRLPIGYALTDLGWTEKRFRNGFEALSDAGFVQYDEPAGVCLIMNALEYQAPENPKQRLGAVRRIEELPETTLLQALYQRALVLAPEFAETLSKRFRNRFETPSKPQAQAQAQTQEKTLMSGKPDAAPVDNSVKDVFEHWQQVMGHPKAKLSNDRRRKIQARLRDGMTVEDLKAAIDGCRASPHHMGENDTGTVYDSIELIFRTTEKAEWFASLRQKGGKVTDPTDLAAARIEKAARMYEDMGEDAAAFTASDEEWREVLKRVGG